MKQTMISVLPETRRKLKILCAQNDCSYDNILVKMIDSFNISRNGEQKKEVKTGTSWLES